MQTTLSSLLLLIATPILAATTTSSGASATHTVQVGQGGFVFSPDSVTAAVGETLEFHFTGSSLHDVVQGPFDAPCMDGDGTGIYSGYPSTSDVFQVVVNNTDPMWLYCSTPGHCAGGMVMVVNQASSGSNTLDAYKSAAGSSSGSSNAPASVQGGSVIAISALGSSGGGSSSASASMSMSGSATATASSTAMSSSAAAGGAGTNVVGSMANVAFGVGMLAWLMG